MNPIELTVGLLAEALDTHVSTEVPQERPERMVVVTLEDDRSDEFILRPVVGLICFGTSDLDAHNLSIAAIAALRMAAYDHPYLSAAQLDNRESDRWGRTGEGICTCLVALTINSDE